MNPAIIRESTIQPSTIEHSFPTPAPTASVRKSLVAKWNVIDGKLVCQWIIED